MTASTVRIKITKKGSNLRGDCCCRVDTVMFAFILYNAKNITEAVYNKNGHGCQDGQPYIHVAKNVLTFKQFCWKCFQDGVCHVNVLTYRSERQIGCHSDISDGQLMLSDVR